MSQYIRLAITLTVQRNTHKVIVGDITMLPKREAGKYAKSYTGIKDFGLPHPFFPALFP